MSDFDLDVVAVSAKKGTDVAITSKSLCTPGCVTGVLHSCGGTNKGCTSVTCGCHF